MKLIDVEALKEKIYSDRDRCDSIMSFFACTLLRIEDAPIVNRWIPCAERLPECGQDVIIYVKSWTDTPIQIAHLQDDIILWELSDGEFYFSLEDVTHWMPLPEQPEKDVTKDDQA